MTTTTTETGCETCGKPWGDPCHRYGSRGTIGGHQFVVPDLPHVAPPPSGEPETCEVRVFSENGGDDCGELMPCTRHAPSGETGDSLDDAMLYLSSRIGGMEQTAADFASPYGQELCRALRTVLGAVASLRERVAQVQSLTNRLTTAQEAAWEYERQVDALTERAEARERDREDAARYRFLKPHLTIDDLGAGGDFDPAEYAIVLRDDAVMLKGIPLGGLDEAIDAARAPSTPSANYYFPSDALIAAMSEAEKVREYERAIAAGENDSWARDTLWPTPSASTGEPTDA